jgi:hypothetical protein
VLQYPTNIYPNGATLDCTAQDDSNRFSFTFNGDFMSGCLYKVYDYNTGQCVIQDRGIMTQDHLPHGYNGDTILSEIGTFDDCINGKDYALQLQLVQYTADGSQPLYDIFALRGVTQENYKSSDGYITIEDKISNIYEWDTYSTDNTRRPSYQWGVYAGTMIMQIGSQKKLITAYALDGKAYLESSFSGSIPAGTPYQIYCNYKVSPLYFFKCRQLPTATLTLSVTNSPLKHHVTGTYSQAQQSTINYYSIELFWSDTNGANSKWRKVDETPKIYSQNIEYDFYDDFVLRYDYREEAAQTYALYYKAVITIMTVDGMTITQDSNVINCGGLVSACPSTTVETYVWDNDRADTFYTRQHMPKHMIDVRYSAESTLPSGTEVMWYRENVQTGETEIVEGIDATVPTKGKQRYYIVPRDSTGRAFLKGISHIDVDCNMKGYTITELIFREDEYQWGTRPRYRTGDQWKFVGEIQDTTITQNTDKYLHVGYNTYPSLTSTQTNYMSGTLSAMIGYVQCTTKTYVDDIDLVRAWRDFITRPTIYMLKSQKGDVWIVNVTENPTTTYSEMERRIPTTFSFSWAECCSVKDIKITYISHNN